VTQTKCAEQGEEYDLTHDNRLSAKIGPSFYTQLIEA
jgi:hypothetical protein